MSDEKTQKQEATKEYVVVFDQLDVNTGEFTPGGPGHAPVAVAASFFRGDKVDLNEADAKRHLESGAVLAANDKRAKLVQPNPVRSQGVRRDADVSLASVVPLEEHAAAVAGGEGAARREAGTLGTEAELGRMKQAELKSLAAEHGVTVERGDNKKSLARKLAAVGASAGAGSQTANPGQGRDESPPMGSVAADAAAKDDDHPAHDE